jgi:hypothetical protein
VRFGASTGGALVILGLLLVVGALFFADSVATVFRLFPVPVLGVILFFGGIELAVGLNGDTFARSERTVLIVTAGIALWNMAGGTSQDCCCTMQHSEGFSASETQAKSPKPPSGYRNSEASSVLWSPAGGRAELSGRPVHGTKPRPRRDPLRRGRTLLRPPDRG